MTRQRAIVAVLTLAAAAACLAQGDERVTFIVKVSPEGRTLLHPMRPIQLHVEQTSKGPEGMNVLAKGDVLHCKPYKQLKDVGVNPEAGTATLVHIVALECGQGRTYAVRGFNFE